MWREYRGGKWKECEGAKVWGQGAAAGAPGGRANNQLLVGAMRAG